MTGRQPHDLVFGPYEVLRTFKENHNHQWLIEWIGFRAPAVVRRPFALTPAARWARLSYNVSVPVLDDAHAGGQG